MKTSAVLVVFPVRHEAKNFVWYMFKVMLSMFVSSIRKREGTTRSSR